MEGVEIDPAASIHPEITKPKGKRFKDRFDIKLFLYWARLGNHSTQADWRSFSFKGIEI